MFGKNIKLKSSVEKSSTLVNGRRGFKGEPPSLKSSGVVDPGEVQARFLFQGPALKPLRVGICSPTEIL